MAVADLYLPLEELLLTLELGGWRPSMEARARLMRYALAASKRGAPTAIEALKYELAALLCRSAEEQAHFYEVFHEFVQPFFGPAIQALDKEEKPPLVPPLPIASPTPTDAPLPPSPTTVQRPAVAAKTTGRSGPIRIDLTFPRQNLRAWNTQDLDQAVRPLREKEWMEVPEWDVVASIQATIRSGGIPQLALRCRKKAPQYLLLIDQKSPRDHLAGLYTDLVTELQQRDLDLVFYYYTYAPYRCWRDPRDPQTYTSVENLQSEYAGYKLLVVGEVDGLLDLPDLRPSNLALDLQNNWREVALLCPKSTAQWGQAELALCPLFPVVPANALGLSTLAYQWAATEVFTPRYWQAASPEPALPVFPFDSDTEADLDHTLDSLYAYLGEPGFQWLCATAVYPELHWELTKLLHKDAVPPHPAWGEGEQNRQWQRSLLRISRVEWYRQGYLPAAVRLYLYEYLQAKLPPKLLQDIRNHLLIVLNMAENQPPPDSYAAVDHAFTIAWYEYERALAAPHLNDAERARIEAEFREKGLAKIQLAEIEDALGQQMYREVQARAVWPAVPNQPGFQVLWVDDEPKNNARLQDELNELMRAIFTNVRSTEEALTTLTERSFDLIVSDVSRYRRDDEGAKMLRAFREKGITIPVIFYTTPAMVEKKGGELREMGAAGVFSNHEEVRKFMEERVREKQQVSNTPPENISQSQSQQQSYTPPPDARIAAAKEAQKAGDAAMENKNYEAAIAAYQQALNLFTELKDDTGRANTHQALGKLYVETGNLENALQHFKSASTLYLMLNFNPAYAYALMDIGSVQRKMHIFKDAQRSYEEARDILEELGDEENIADVSNIIGELYASQGMAQNRSREKINIIETTEQLQGEWQGIILYSIPNEMQLGKQVRCTIRVATSVDKIRESWKVSPDDVQETIYVIDRTSISLEEALKPDSNNLAFDITSISMPEKQIKQSEYAQWFFDVEPKEIGTHQLALKITLFKMNRGSELQRITVIEREITATAPPTKNTKQAAPTKASRKK